ncbi:MAG: hypothetical protein O4859_29325, partial [Trichodesmium sp. St18_bin1]|nr:hypothetical protein [Trichodesmium sp. St18_bin1]
SHTLLKHYLTPHITAVWRCLLPREDVISSFFLSEKKIVLPNWLNPFSFLLLIELENRAPSETRF